MDKKILTSPEQVKKILQRVFDRNFGSWLQAEGEWPLSIKLNIPKENTALNNLLALQDWVKIWQQWRGVGELQWVTRHWKKIGKQNFPEKLLIHTADDVSIWLDEHIYWRRACLRFQESLAIFPKLNISISKHYEILAQYTDEDWKRLLSVLTWFKANSNSNLYLRQLPILGIDTKWIESRKNVVSQFVKVLLDRNEENDFHKITGLKSEPTLIKIRFLDDKLRNKMSDLDFIAISRGELVKLSLSIQNIFIVENIRTGLAFHDIPNSIVIMGLGYGVECFANIPWIRCANCFYWGDIDTHGFAILNRLRSYIPNIKSVLMDKNTLLPNRNLWSKEEKPMIAEELLNLTQEELSLYTALRDKQWGAGVRLEQERINWELAWKRITLLPHKW